MTCTARSGQAVRSPTVGLLGVITLAVVVLLGWAVPASAEAPAPDPATARYEIDFMSNMIDHHHMAIEMSEICLERAVHHELR
ncbi:MAG: DUF305 domain-containing protein, partial [Actinomycetota bacterium]|nr:DUF305 domain-containing protein [Actinomycetota bacterium]